MTEKVVVNTTAPKDNTKLFMILGIIAVAGLAIYFMRKPKDATTPPVVPGGGLQRLGDDLDMPDSDDIDTDDDNTAGTISRD